MRDACDAPGGPVTALQKIGMGLVITLVDTDIRGFDGVPDLLGWVLVVLGVRELRDRVPTSTLLPLALVAGVVSLALVHGTLTEDLPESTGWLLSLPQLAFSFVLCREVAVLVTPAPAAGTEQVRRVGDQLAGRYRILSWLFGVAAAGPVLLYGGGVDLLLTPLAVLTVAANVYLVYLLFRTSSLIHPRPPRGAEGGEVSR